MIAVVEQALQQSAVLVVGMAGRLVEDVAHRVLALSHAVATPGVHGHALQVRHPAKEEEWKEEVEGVGIGAQLLMREALGPEDAAAADELEAEPCGLACEDDGAAVRLEEQACDLGGMHASHASRLRPQNGEAHLEGSGQSLYRAEDLKRGQKGCAFANGKVRCDGVVVLLTGRRKLEGYDGQRLGHSSHAPTVDPDGKRLRAAFHIYV